MPQQILKLVENWDGPRNEYWISVDPLSAHVRHTGQILIGPESKTVEELERIAQILHSDLERVIAEARIKIARQDLK